MALLVKRGPPVRRRALVCDIVVDPPQRRPAQSNPGQPVAVRYLRLALQGRRNGPTLHFFAYEKLPPRRALIELFAAYRLSEELELSAGRDLGGSPP